MALIHTEGDPVITVNPDTGSVLVIVSEEYALRFRSAEHLANWSEAFDRASLNAFAAEVRRSPQLPLADAS